MLHLLPAEIALHAVSCLPLQSLYSINLVSHAWHDLMKINEPAVYRHAATLHRFIDEEQLRTGSVPDDWKAYCERQLEIERGWRGKAPSAVRELSATGTVVHRIKVDYELGLIITTYQTGGLTVCDIKDNRILWGLLSHAVHHAHCEYDRGYIIFNRYDNCKEVWRRTLDVDGDQPSRTSPPDKRMLDASAQAAAQFNSEENRRGHFKAWALLHMPDIARAFRFSYPTLLAASARNAYIWDVPRSQLVLTIEDIQQQYHGQLLAAVMYVEVNDQYVFICGGSILRIFSREGGGLLYQLCTRELSSATWNVHRQGRGSSNSIIHPQMLLPHPSPSFFRGDFVACHVSASGNDLVVLTSNGRLVILPHFQRLFAASNPVHHRDMAIVLDFQPFSHEEHISYYLAVGSQNGKFALATSKGIFLISPDIDFDRLTAERPCGPGIFVCRLSNFEKEDLLASITCLQITHDAIYFSYKPSYALAARAAPLQHGGVDVHEPPDLGVIVGADDDLDDDFEDEWVVDDEDDEDLMGLPMGEGQDALHAVLDIPWAMPTTSNTVYSVSF